LSRRIPMPFQWCSVGQTLCLARTVIANAILGLVDVAKYKSAQTLARYEYCSLGDSSSSSQGQ